MNTDINCFSLMNNAAKRLKGVFWKACLASLVVIFPIVAVLFIPYYVGIVLSVLFSGYLFYGLIIYYKKLFAGENPSLKVIFNNWDRFPAATLIGIINFVCLVVGLIVLIIPAIVYLIYYSVNLYLLADQSEPKVKECFTHNASRMVTNKTLVLSYKVLFYFLFAVVFGICGLIFIPLYSMTVSNLALAVFLIILLILFGIALITLVNVLYQATQYEFYTNHMVSLEEASNIVKERNEKIISKKTAKNTEDAKEDAESNETEESKE